MQRSEQQMPARIWAGSGYDLRFWQKCKPDDLADSVCQTAFIRADIAERMAEALEDMIEAVRRDSDGPEGRGISGYTSARLSDARSALSAFRSATQDTGARHD